MAAKKGQKFPPLYNHSFAEADACGEAEQYNASHNLNAEKQPYPLIFVLTGIIIVLGIAFIIWGYKEKK